MKHNKSAQSDALTRAAGFNRYVFLKLSVVVNVDK
jgi:hypothetical protein